MMRLVAYTFLVSWIAIAQCRKLQAAPLGSASMEAHITRTLAASFKEEEAMHVIYTVCGGQAKGDVLASVKTLWLFASLSLSRGKHYYHIHVLTDGSMTLDDLSFLQPSSHFKASTHPLHSGSVYLFRPCSSERLYMHEHAELKDVDKALYLDGDSLWLDHPLELWSHLGELQRTNAVWGLVEEAAAGRNWYTEDATHPYYGERGLNAGVLLVDLARVRESNFSAERDDIIATWGKKGALPWGDQDVLNIYLNRHRDQAYVLPCKFNVRSDSVCSDIAPVVYHGNRALKDNQDHQYSHLYTLFSMIKKSDLKLSGKPWSAS